MNNEELDIFKDIKLYNYNVSLANSKNYGFCCKIYNENYSYCLYDLPKYLFNKNYKIFDLVYEPNKYVHMSERKFLKHIKYDSENYYLGKITHSNNFQDFIMPYVDLFNNKKNSFVNINEFPDLQISYIDISRDIINKYPNIFNNNTYAIKYVIYDKNDIVNLKRTPVPFYRVFDLNVINILNLDIELEKDFLKLEKTLKNNFIESKMYFKPFDVLDRNRLCSVKDYINYSDVFDLDTYKYLQIKKTKLNFLENNILKRTKLLLENRDIYDTDLMSLIAEKNENIIYKIQGI